MARLFSLGGLTGVFHVAIGGIIIHVDRLIMLGLLQGSKNLAHGKSDRLAYAVPRNFSGVKMIVDGTLSKA